MACIFTHYGGFLLVFSPFQGLKTLMLVGAKNLDFTIPVWKLLHSLLTGLNFHGNDVAGAYAVATDLFL